MMGHIPADREWVGSSEAVAVEESTDNKSEAVEKCKFTIGLAKKGLGLKSIERNKEAGVEVQQQTSESAAKDSLEMDSVCVLLNPLMCVCVFMCVCKWYLCCDADPLNSTACIQRYKPNPLMADSKSISFIPRTGWFLLLLLRILLVCPYMMFLPLNNIL